MIDHDGPSMNLAYTKIESFPWIFHHQDRNTWLCYAMAIFSLHNGICSWRTFAFTSWQSSRFGRCAHLGRNNVLGIPCSNVNAIDRKHNAGLPPKQRLQSPRPLQAGFACRSHRQQRGEGGGSTIPRYNSTSVMRELACPVMHLCTWCARWRTFMALPLPYPGVS